MNLEDYRILFAVTTLALILIVAFPTLSLVVEFPRSPERFSELWVLDSNRMTENYPFNVQIGEKHQVFVGGSNHLGRSAYYLVYVKFRNQSQPLQDEFNSTLSSLSSIYEFRLLVPDGASWEVPFTFEFLEVSRLENSCIVQRMSINDVVFSVDASSSWDSENSGFYYELFFELWFYNTTSHVFQYHNRFVGIWLNMTCS